MRLAVVLALAGLTPALVMWSAAPPQRRRARAWWITGLLAAGAVALAPVEPWMSVVTVALLVWWYREPDELVGDKAGPDLPPVVLGWAAVAATWLLVRALPESYDLGLMVLWGAVGSAQAARMLYERVYGEDRRAPHGGLAQRFYAGSTLAVLCAVLPLAFWPVLLVGLFLSGPSWLGVLALAAGSVVRWPWTMPYLGALILVAASALLVARGRPVWPLSLLPRGDSLDGARVRWTVWRLALADWLRAPGLTKLIGFGPGSAPRSSRRWNLRYRGLEALGNFHCEPVQVAYEYGLLGVLGLALFGARLWSGFQWGDPWTAGAVAALVVACGANSSGVPPLGVTCLIIWARVSP